MAWLTVINIYYCEWQPGQMFTPDQWMHTTIVAIWTFSMTLWCQQHCASYHGINGIHTLEWKHKAMALCAKEVYQETIGAITPMANLLLHWHNLNTMMNWTNQPLDAYLAMAKVLCDWNVEPG